MPGPMRFRAAPSAVGGVSIVSEVSVYRSASAMRWREHIRFAEWKDHCAGQPHAQMENSPAGPRHSSGRFDTRRVPKSVAPSRKPAGIAAMSPTRGPRVRWQRACYLEPRSLMPVVPFDPARARPRGQARPPKPPVAQTAAMTPRAPGTPAGAALPPGAMRPQAPGVAAGAAKAPSTATSAPPPRTQPLWSSEPAGGVMMPAHVPPAPPRLAINLSPAAATRALSMLGLGVALSATVATTLAVIAASPGGLPTETPAA